MLMIKCALQYCSGDFARLLTQFTINVKKAALVTCKP